MSPSFWPRISAFKDGTTTLATETLTSGATTFTTSKLTLGSHSITVVYGGSTNFATSTSTALTETVAQDGTTSIVVSSANPSAFGQAVVFTAVEIPIAPGVGTPTGTVTFKDGTTTLATETLSGGTATFFTSALATGTHSITVAYSGDTHFKASTSPILKQTVQSSGSAAIVASNVSSAETSVTAIQSETGTPAAPSVQDLALKQVSTERRGHRHRTGNQRAEHQAQIKVTESVSRLGRRAAFSRTTGAHRPKGLLAREAVAHENRR